jgi:hypothetical protein
MVSATSWSLYFNLKTDLHDLGARHSEMRCGEVRDKCIVAKRDFLQIASVEQWLGSAVAIQCSLVHGSVVAVGGGHRFRTVRVILAR